MKKIIPLFTFIILSFSLSAKKVKFAVDMSNQTVSSLGVHVVGDFQVAAGYALDWDPSLTQLTKEGSTDIYSIVVNIPAFQKYEYRFVNGDQTYESEFVPDESRVGYDFIDTRWFYLDSLQNDTSYLGAVLFAGNAPAGLNLVRYKVDMSNVTASPLGVHLSASYNSFSPVKNQLYSFAINPSPNVYEVISYLASGTYSFNFVNGNTSGATEASVPSACSNSGLRYITVTKDTVFPDICFNSCLSCSSVSVKEINFVNTFKVFPNPAKNSVSVLSTDNSTIEEINIYNIAGQKVLQYLDIKKQNYSVADFSLSPGLYMMSVKNQNNQTQNLKLIIE